MFDTSVFGVLALDARRRITSSNAAFSAMSGYAHDRALGMELANLLVWDRGPGDSVAQPIGPGIHDCRLQTSDGDTRWVTVDVRDVEADDLMDDDARPS